MQWAAGCGWDMTRRSIREYSLEKQANESTHSIFVCLFSGEGPFFFRQSSRYTVYGADRFFESRGAEVLVAGGGGAVAVSGIGLQGDRPGPGIVRENA